MDANRLTRLQSLATGDGFLVYSLRNADLGYAPLDVVADAISDDATAANGNRPTIYGSPSATGFSIPVPLGNVFVLLQPPVNAPTGYATGTVTLPGAPQDGDEVEIYSKIAVSTFNVLPGASSMGIYGPLGAPVTLNPADRYRLRFDGPSRVWNSSK